MNYKVLFGKSSLLDCPEWVSEVQIFQATLESPAKLCTLQCTNSVCFFHSSGLIVSSTLLCVNHGCRTSLCRMSSENPSSYAIHWSITSTQLLLSSLTLEFLLCVQCGLNTQMIRLWTQSCPSSCLEIRFCLFQNLKSQLTALTKSLSTCLQALGTTRIQGQV